MFEMVPDTGWQQGAELEARLKEARRTCSALEIENQVLIV